MILAVEGREQRPLSGAVISLDVDDIHPDIPFAEGALIEASVGGMIDPENEEGDDTNGRFM